MNKKFGMIMVLLGSLLFSQTPATAQMKDRSQVDEKYKWNLADLYDSDEAWDAEKDRVAKQADELLAFKGKLGESSATMLKCFKLSDEVNKELTRLYIYASQKFDLDTRETHSQGLKQQIEQIWTDTAAKTSFIEPEILKIDNAKIDKFLKEEKGLKIYEFYLKDLQRQKKHRLSEGEEAILAKAGMVTGAPYNIYSIFANAELPYKEVELSDGSKVKLNSAGYARSRAVKNRDDRKLVFDTFFNTLGEYQKTLATQLGSAVKSDLFYAQARGYETCLDRALDANNIPTDVYHALIKGVNENLDTFHRYLKIKQRMLGVDTLKFIDIYAPTVAGVDLDYTIDEANVAVLESLKPLGKEYVEIVEKAMNERWIDVYPSEGKRSGAYSSGDAYDVHPFILLNFNGKYDDVSTLTHEVGHTMQSYLSNQNQPYATADYPIFVAEVASTFNEALLIDKQLGEIKDDNVRLALLMNYLDGVKGTVFRQTQFAEFELKMHELAEKGEPLTADTLTELYGGIARKYYGHDKGVCIVDEPYLVEWAYIPHFYYNYYVYQYATSFCASTALSEKVLAKEKGALDKYLEFLSAGGSDYPINLLKKAGVDMTGSEPFDKTMAAMNRTMDEIEKILDKM